MAGASKDVVPVINESGQGYKDRNIFVTRLDYSPLLVLIQGTIEKTATELLVLLPLNTGNIYIRSGDKASRFAKYDHQVCVRLQELLKESESSK